MMATFAVPVSSASVKARPLRSGMPAVEKYSGVMAEYCA